MIGFSAVEGVLKEQTHQRRKMKTSVCCLLMLIAIEPSQISSTDLQVLPEYVQNVGAGVFSKLFFSDDGNSKRQSELLNGAFSNLSMIVSNVYADHNSTKIPAKIAHLKADNSHSEIEHDSIKVNELSTVAGGSNMTAVQPPKDESEELIDRDVSDDNENAKAPPLVSTAEGIVQGIAAVADDGFRYYSFVGIPYASPPKRFQAAKPPVPWTGIKDATSDGEICIQRAPVFETILGSEDCLHLNIHTPSLDAVGLPVMVMVHGGAFKAFTGNSYLFGAEQLVKENMVHVSFNYRLGPFGFLATKTPEAPGNMAMKDMIAALRWVRRNVHMFGGDPHRVTLYGGSTGSIAVEYITLSKMAEDLFSQTITQSGSVLNYWAYTKEPMKYAYRLGTYLGLNKTGTNDLMKVLNEATAEDIIEASEKMGRDENPTGDFLTFVPCAENSFPGEEIFLHDHPENILMSGDFIKVPSMVGFNDFEGSEFIKPVYDNSEYLNGLDDSFEFLMPTDLMQRLKSPRSRAAVTRRVRDFYFNGGRISNDTAKQFVDMMGDSKFLYGLFKSVTIRLEKSPTPIYYWEFAYDSDYSIFKQLYGVGISGAAHGDDLAYIFETPFFFGSEKSNTSVEVSQKLITLISNFVKSGNPTPTKTQSIPLIWTPIRSGEALEYMRITDKIEMKKTPNKERMLLWKNLYADFANLI